MPQILSVYFATVFHAVEYPNQPQALRGLHIDGQKRCLLSFRYYLLNVSIVLPYYESLESLGSASRLPKS